MRRAFFLVVLLSVIDLGCKPSWIVGKSAECRDFYRLPIEQQQVSFETFPPDKQIRIYQCGMDREPPDIARAYDIADGGEKVVPYLVQSLKAEQNDYAKDNIVYVFEIMSERDQLRGRHEIIDLIRNIVSNMKSGARKELSKKRLEKIEKNSKQ
ncbi:MAG TPA: hypothetical protein VLG74_04020 [Blastocatellia bacterium]|nr:hypothetical protein [Blastocatellia bacterium]